MDSHETLPTTEPQTTPRQRHGFLTFWLVLMIVANAFTCIGYLMMTDKMTETTGVPRNMILLLGALSAVNVLLAIFLFQWKKWAFFGFVATAIAAAIINTAAGLPIGQSLIGLIGIAVLYGVLQIRKNGVSAWDQLEN